MRVVHIIKVVRAAGAEQHLLKLLAGLRARDIDARMILLVEPNNDMESYVQALGQLGIPVQRMTIYRHTDVMLVKRLRDLLRAQKPDIVHTHLIHADLFATLAARWAKVPLIVTSRHDSLGFRYRLLIRLANRAMWYLADAGIAISDAIKRFTIEVEGAAPDKMQRIYYGLDTNLKPLERKVARKALGQSLGLKADDLLIGMVCRLIEEKGIGYAIEAFSQVAPEFPNARLVIVGEGPLKADLQHQAKQTGLGERIHFLGWREDVPALLAGLDLLLAPSLSEGLGLVMLEAMAQQVAVIGSTAGAIPEVIAEGETGLLVPPGDSMALAEAVRQLLRDTPLRQHMGLLGRDRLETVFSATQMIEATAALYRRLLKTKQG